MFILTLFQAGDTTDCTINGEPVKVTWTDQHELKLDNGETLVCHRKARR
jgi:hypothetical protein